VQINNDRILEAVLSTNCSPLAMQEGAALVDNWVNDERDFDDEILAVEVGFSVQVDELTWVIGVQDLICADAKGVYGREHKTTKEPGRYWSEQKWLEEIKSGPQIAVYALALSKGVFYENGQPFVLNVPTPVRERVRAVVKIPSPLFWPENVRNSWQEFDDLSLERVSNAFVVKAEGIRTARRSGLVPWQLTGRQCTDFNRLCGYFDECSRGVLPESASGFDGRDPAAKFALPFLPDEARGDEAVILSASSYASYSRCMELGRRDAMSGGKEESLALEIGTVVHSGCAEFYRQLKEQQHVKNAALSGSILGKG
jgi:hypothetical protein